MFTNRTMAGRQLAEAIEQHLLGLPHSDRSNLLVVGLPRGGVPVALEVARRLTCPLEVILSKKLSYPGQPEYAIGAVSSDGLVVLNPDLPEDPAWRQYIDNERQRLLRETRSSEAALYQEACRIPSAFNDRTVIVVDDGVATGMTAIAALGTARKRGAKCTIMAAPVMSCQSYDSLRLHTEAVIALLLPDDFHSVGQYYRDFTQTSTAEVVSALRESSHFHHRVDTGGGEIGAARFDA